MKKIALSSIFILLLQAAFADGLVTNSNQSAQYIRMLSRNGSTGIDAVYFNPAGLTLLENGMHFAFYNQSIFQNNTLYSDFKFLNDPEYSGKANQMFFPAAFFVYKKDNLALSLGFGQNGSFGSAKYDRGIPSLEIPVSRAQFLIPIKVRNSYMVNGYDADFSYSQSSVYRGIQLGASYKANDYFSVYGGFRVLPSKNKFEGNVSNINLNVGGETFPAPVWLTETSANLSSLAATSNGLATSYNGAAATLQQLISGGAGNYTIAQIHNAGYISSADRASFESALARLGMSGAEISALKISQVKSHFSTAAESYANTAASSAAAASRLLEIAPMLEDKELKTEQGGTGFTPVLGINISPFENLNIGVRYEMKTKLELSNYTEADDFGIFPDRGKMSYDVPAILAMGIAYKPIEWLQGQASFNLFFDKGVEWGQNLRYLLAYPEFDEEYNRREVKSNSYEFGLGLEFIISDSFTASIGMLSSKPGVAKSYQSEFSYINQSFTAGGGLQYKINNKITLDAGFSKTFFKDVDLNYFDPETNINYTDIYSRTSLRFAFGLSYSIFNN